jgi:copper chaperone CopZ
MSQAKSSGPSISCGHCVRTIRAALGELAGVQQVDVNIDTKQVAVIYEPAAVSETEMKATLAEANYPVAEAGAEQAEELTLVADGASCGCCRI